jgi:hypothetical protein
LKHRHAQWADVAKYEELAPTSLLTSWKGVRLILSLRSRGSSVRMTSLLRARCHSVHKTSMIIAAIVAAVSLTGPAHAGNGSTVGAGIVGFGVGALVGSALAPQTVYVAPPPPVYYAPPPPVYVAPPPPIYVGPAYYYARPPYRRHRH